MNNIKQQLKETLGNINKSSSNKNQIVLKLKTLTPLYTGGIGQQGDQIHPSNLLGGIRHFSCLVARFLGEKYFETEVWGTAEESEPKAKQIALKWDTSELKPINFHNKKIKINNNKGWYFSSAFEGELTLQITKQFTKCDKNIKEQFEKYWNILLISIAIQIRHAMFGSKDQFGLGVLDLVKPAEYLKKLPKLNADDFKENKNNKDINLSNCFLVRTRFSIKYKKDKKYDFLEDIIKAGLTLRYNMRNSLRNLTNNDEINRIIRHRVFGNINKKDKNDDFSSLINISAFYPLDDKIFECRIFFIADFNKIMKFDKIKNFVQKNNFSLEDSVVSKIFRNENIFRTINNYNLLQPKPIQICEVRKFNEDVSKKINLLNVLAGVK